MVLFVFRSGLNLLPSFPSFLVSLTCVVDLFYRALLPYGLFVPVTYRADYPSEAANHVCYSSVCLVMVVVLEVVTVVVTE